MSPVAATYSCGASAGGSKAVKVQVFHCCSSPAGAGGDVVDPGPQRGVPVHRVVRGRREHDLSVALGPGQRDRPGRSGDLGRDGPDPGRQRVPGGRQDARRRHERVLPGALRNDPAQAAGRSAAAGRQPLTGERVVDPDPDRGATAHRVVRRGAEGQSVVGSQGTGQGDGPGRGGDLLGGVPVAGIGVAPDRRNRSDRRDELVLAGAERHGRRLRAGPARTAGPQPLAGGLVVHAHQDRALLFTG